jgi:hypothetical protein
MSLSIATLSGYPALNTTFQATNFPSFYATGVAVGSSNSPSPTVAATYSYTSSTTFPTNGSYVYTQSGTQYVAGIIDYAGVVPARLFYANNGSGFNANTQPLPTLNYIVQHQVTCNDGSTEYGGYTVVLYPAEPGPDSGQSSTTGDVNQYGNTTSVTQYSNEPILIPAQGYTANNPVSGYPQPQLRFKVSMAALLILSSTQY